jgi:hypothetical protein
MDRPQISVPDSQEPDAYDVITLRWLLVPETLKVHLLLHLIHSLSPEQTQELRACCEEDIDDWGNPWD